MALAPQLASRLADLDVLVLPGWRNSGPAHWQTHWEARFPEWRRVEQDNWNYPKREDWVASLDRAIARSSRPVLLVAHSLGCITVAHWAASRRGGQVAGALLVAPADVERATVAGSLRGFAPLPRSPLPFPTLVVASDNDPACSLWRAAELAADWRAGFHVLPGSGHINADSGLGDWDAGLVLLRDWLDTAGVAKARPPLRWVA